MNKQIMKIWGVLLLVTLSFAITVQGQELKLEGIYQGKNVYVQNPTVGAGKFCVTAVKVNGIVTSDVINSNSFEINLSVYDFKIGEKVQIIVNYSNGCKPKIANPEVLESKSTYTVTTMKVDNKTNMLSFSTTGESGILKFTIEQFRWNKWIKVGEIQGKGISGVNGYQIQINLCSGDNVFRVRQTDFTKLSRISKVYKFRSMSPPVTYNPLKKNTNEILFSDVTMYEIYDSYGRLKLKGTGNKADISSLAKSDKSKYILLFDNQEVEFVKE